ncbi:hypothetical protein D6D01_08443 [Aureobasidium pullulans]|uniref:Uncharacterized protein n=1 Tax=Aureobasidium pullulans TaxID=5580 RepID=A0A4S9KB63_AURPU|nr:hypothetical protein D6D01_08443 [Aureobasidium pullulans]
MITPRTMSQTTNIILALVLSILFVFLFWYIWVKLLDWELKVWYGKILRRREREVEQTEMDLEGGGGIVEVGESAGGKDGGDGSQAGEGGGDGGGGSKPGSKAGASKSGSKSGNKAVGSKSGSKAGSDKA